MTLHFTKGIPSTCLLVIHMKEKHLFLIFVKMPLGMYAIDAQCTGILYKMAFNSTNIPPLERKRLAQLLTLLSIFLYNQTQS